MRSDDHIDIEALCLSYKKYFPEDQTEEEFIADTIAMRFPNKIRGKLEKYKSTWLANHPGEEEAEEEMEEERENTTSPDNTPSPSTDKSPEPENAPSPPMDKSPVPDTTPAPPMVKSPVPETTPATDESTPTTSSEPSKKIDKSQHIRIFFTYSIKDNNTRIDPRAIRSVFEVPGLKSFTDIPTTNDKCSRMVGMVFLRRVTRGRVQSVLLEHFKITPNFTLNDKEKGAIAEAVANPNTITDPEDKEAAKASKKESSILQRMGKLETLLADSLERIEALEAMCGEDENEERRRKKKKQRK